MELNKRSADETAFVSVLEKLIISSEQNAVLNSRNKTTIQQPLQIDLILNKILKTLDYPTLKICRLVSRKWNSAFFAAFERRTNLLIDFQPDSKTISEFVTTFSSAYKGGWIYKRLQFVSPKHLDDSLMSNWMTEYGINIKSIKFGCDAPSFYPVYDLWKQFITSLNETPFRYSISLKSFRNLLLKWCPNLENLSIPFPCIKNDDDKEEIKFNLNEFNRPDESCTISLKTLELGTRILFLQYPNLDYRVENIATMILKVVPSVQNLTLKTRKMLSTGLVELSNFLSTREGSSLANSLTTLDLCYFRIQPIVFSTLAVCNLRNLKSLSLGSVTSFTTEDAAHFELFLDSIAPNLEELTLFPDYESPRNVFRFRFPEMTSLTTLIIGMESWDAGTMDFTVMLPNLGSLRLSDWGITAFPQSFTDTPQLDKILRKEVVKRQLKLKQRFIPDLTKLAVVGPIDYVFIQGVVKYFRNLKDISVSLNASAVLNSLTLMSKLQKLNTLSIMPSQCSKEIVRLNEAITATLPQFIALKKFTLSLPEELKTTKIHSQLSGEAVQKGFFCAPKLAFLNLCNLKISPQVYEILLRPGNKIRVKFTNCIIELNY